MSPFRPADFKATSLHICDSKCFALSTVASGSEVHRATELKHLLAEGAGGGLAGTEQQPGISNCAFYHILWLLLAIQFCTVTPL